MGGLKAVLFLLFATCALVMGADSEEITLPQVEYQLATLQDSFDELRSQVNEVVDSLKIAAIDNKENLASLAKIEAFYKSYMNTSINGIPGKHSEHHSRCPPCHARKHVHRHHHYHRKAKPTPEQRNDSHNDLRHALFKSQAEEENATLEGWPLNSDKETDSEHPGTSRVAFSAKHDPINLQKQAKNLYKNHLTDEYEYYYDPIEYDPPIDFLLDPNFHFPNKPNLNASPSRVPPPTNQPDDPPPTNQPDDTPPTNQPDDTPLDFLLDPNFHFPNNPNLNASPSRVPPPTNQPESD